MFNPDTAALNRRTMLGLLATAATAVPRYSAAADTSPKSAMGLVAYSCGLRRKQQRDRDPQADLFAPRALLAHCRTLGLGGIQTSLGVLDAEQVRALRDDAERHDMYVEGIVSPPQDEADVARFDAEIRTAAEVGASVVRTVIMPGRRYEQFNSLEEFRAAEARGVRMLELAAPVVTKHRVRLAVENHKDQRLEERTALHRRFASEYVGACGDTGNSFALLDEPYEVIEQLAPYAFTVHLKDQALREYADGFLLGDIPLGAGCFDLRRMVDVLRRAHPTVRFNLELITRDPLKVTCLTEKYWATMSAASGTDLARTLRFVRAHPAEQLQQVAELSPAAQVELEDANLAASRTYAREVLAL